ncbi:MAG: methyltransferase domain-containing protein [Alphaproteobacteria bacterium]
MTDAKRASGTWDPGQYARFGDHRVRPALELFARVDHPGPALAADLGCGGGEIARLMAERWPQARVIGMDSSTEMLAKAAKAPARVEWQQADIRTWTPPGKADLLYSNAMLHWVEDHGAVFPRLFGMLAPGGILAVQMPLSWPEPSHQALRQVLADLDLGGPDLRASVDRRWVLDTDFYYDLLKPLADGVDIWETRYLQVLQGDDPILEWVKGTALTPVLDALPPADQERFLSEYGSRLRRLYPRRAGGETLFPFPRLFIVARAAA